MRNEIEHETKRRDAFKTVNEIQEENFTYEDATTQAFQFATVTIMYLRIQLVSASLSVREPSSRLDIVLNPSELHPALPTTIPPIAAKAPPSRSKRFEYYIIVAADKMQYDIVSEEILARNSVSSRIVPLGVRSKWRHQSCQPVLSGMVVVCILHCAW